MPPASPAATLAWRMASRMLVLPWSTCPITVPAGVGATGLEVLAYLGFDRGRQLGTGVRERLVALTQPTQDRTGLLVELPRQLTYPDSTRRAAFSSWDGLPPSMDSVAAKPEDS